MRQEMIGFWDGGSISWTICKQSAPCCRQITTSTPYHPIFTGQMLFLTPNKHCQSTEGTLRWCTFLICNSGAVNSTSPWWVTCSICPNNHINVSKITSLTLEKKMWRTDRWTDTTEALSTWHKGCSQHYKKIISHISSPADNIWQKDSGNVMETYCHY